MQRFCGFSFRRVADLKVRKTLCGADGHWHFLPGSVDAALKEIFSGSPLLAIHHQLQVANVKPGLIWCDSEMPRKYL